MLSLFKNKNSGSPGYFPIVTDMHSHILPGIDDGSPDVDTSIALVKGLIEIGLTHSIATPHIISDMYRNTPETIQEALDNLRNALADEGIDYSIDAAAEYLMDDQFFEMVRQKQKLLTVKDKLILTEFPWSFPPAKPEKMSFAIIIEGYTPILAHPERYTYFHNDYKIYHRLKELGFLLQVNILSLCGYYGPAPAKAARYILDNDLNSFLGTDLHHHKHLQALQDAYNSTPFQKLLQNKTWNTELQNN
ncbi:MAG: hypothetical protein IPL97_13945 [Niastella sp.]|nr:hypothetical protein [Niastella sp.]